MTLAATDHVETLDDLVRLICWDDGEDPATELAGGRYQTCGGEWRREAGGRWRFFEDEAIAYELRSVS